MMLSHKKNFKKINDNLFKVYNPHKDNIFQLIVKGFNNKTGMT